MRPRPSPSLPIACALLSSYLLSSHAAPGQQAPTFRGTPRVMQGPMVGATSPDAVKIWVRLSGPWQTSLRYGSDPDLRLGSPYRTRTTAPVRARAEHDYCVELVADELEPDREVYYEVLVEERPDKYLGSLAPFVTRTAPAGNADFRIAFGSCARFGEDRVQSIWRQVENARPAAFLWLGDNIYGDSVDARVLREEYRRQRDVAMLQPLLRSVPQLATWDDHDFGLNDSDRRHPGKRDALAAFAEYWANPSVGTPDTKGCFCMWSFGGVDLFLLDDRYWRDPNEAPDGASKTMLGAGQLAWLKAGLRASRAPFKLLCSGSGWSVAKGPGGDSWASYLTERDALFDWITAERIPGVVLLSGDTHVSELNVIPWSEKGGYDFYDLVSSPLAQDSTGSWLRRTPEQRVRPVYFGGACFGRLDLEMTRDDPVLGYRVVDERGHEVGKPFRLRASELVPGVSSWRGKLDGVEPRSRN